MVPGLSSIRFLLDDTSLAFLALFGIVWLVSGVYSALTLPSAERGRYFAYYIPAAVGGLGVAVAGDAISFYLFFSLMALSSWGLVTHARTPEARRAGAIYLVLTAISEALLLAGLIILSFRAGSTELSAFAAGVNGADALAALLVLGAIGIKIGTLPASGILPLTYTNAPAGAASALAGASAKVGALAMVRLLPFGGLPEQWGGAVMVLGLVTAFGAAAIGLFTTRPRGVLGYSSASQMGLMLVAAGTGLSHPEVAHLSTGAILAFALHHGLAKSALVVGEDVVSRVTGRARTAALAALTLPAAALVGVPFSSGFAAKYALKDAVHALSGGISESVYALLPWTAIGTALLMVRFFGLLQTGQQRRPGHAWFLGLWGVLLASTVGVVWLWPAEWNDHALESVFSGSAVWAAIWPALIAAAIALVVWRVGDLWRRPGVLPAGDVLLPAAALVRSTEGILKRRDALASKPTRAKVKTASPLQRVEMQWVAWTAASTIFALLALAAVALATRG